LYRVVASSQYLVCIDFFQTLVYNRGKDRIQTVARCFGEVLSCCIYFRQKDVFLQSAMVHLLYVHFGKIGLALIAASSAARFTLTTTYLPLSPSLLIEVYFLFALPLEEEDFYIQLVK